ncbi:MAG: hypothetical protein BWX56_00458 [Euryarchaeota archaeon ADurb.Bin023]|jgi:hypothetical protein|uniref:Uncharacterized protein n=1 Tax=Candidatus Methanofastidiosum methylothiophilum TaxID=1705564 RepID=A0A150JL50_9EURY|nr:MAG: hypothetical protein APG09_00681 [Candidatus Methanofastidiosum methylthiophilus]OQC52243.1 MAG: hypothetical protein BWX56_00458 [Euryarchaeota archaeon ADurb.Bin023]HNZ60932.1 hypothetical protein [Methanofastidiosum sp.]HPX23689.1 hypothetical protein [Methanofastidiosum sp.]
MKKKITLSILFIMAISLSAAFGAIGQWNTGDPYIPCYNYQDNYTYPATAINPGQIISFDVPSCPPSKTIRIGGPEEEAKNSPTYEYECSLSSDQGCCIGGGFFAFCVSDHNNIININVTTYDAEGNQLESWGLFSSDSCVLRPVMINGRRTTRFEVHNQGRTPATFTTYLDYACCYDCRKKVGLPTTILYPKVDIENFAVAGGTTVIKDGKLLTNLALSPGTQQTFVQIENRGMFTQNDTRAKFEGLPEGVTVSITPETQKLKAKKIGTYSATFTVGPNVPSGKYQVTLVAYSEKGVFDKITFDFIVP